MPDPSTDRTTIFRVFFFAVFLYLLYQFMLVLTPFFKPLVLAVALALIFFPVHQRFLRACGGRPNAAAGLSVATLLLLVIVPAGLFLWLFIRESITLLPAIRDRLTALQIDAEGNLSMALPGPLTGLVQRVNHFLDVWNINLREILAKNLDQIGTRASALGATVVRNMMFLLFNLFILAFSLFFLFRDGQGLVRKLADLIPMEQDHKSAVLRRLDETLSAVVRGMFITALVQGVLAGIGYAAAGQKLAIVLAAATAFTAMIPIVGAAATWVPVTLYIASTGAVLKALLLFLWGALIVSGVDNVLRPLLIGERTKIPLILLFFGTLGGLQVYGIVGLLLGPLLIAGLLSFLRIYGEIIQRPVAEADASPPPSPPKDERPPAAPAVP